MGLPITEWRKEGTFDVSISHLQKTRKDMVAENRVDIGGKNKFSRKPVRRGTTPSGTN